MFKNTKYCLLKILYEQLLLLLLFNDLKPSTYEVNGVQSYFHYPAALQTAFLRYNVSINGQKLRKKFKRRRWVLNPVSLRRYPACYPLIHSIFIIITIFLFYSRVFQPLG